MHKQCKQALFKFSLNAQFCVFFSYFFTAYCLFQNLRHKNLCFPWIPSFLFSSKFCEFLLYSISLKTVDFSFNQWKAGKAMASDAPLIDPNAPYQKSFFGIFGALKITKSKACLKGKFSSGTEF